MNINEYKERKFRELKAKKKTFGFELAVYDPASIIAAAKAIEMAEWMDKGVLVEFKTHYSARELKIYTDDPALSGEMRLLC